MAALVASLDISSSQKWASIALDVQFVFLVTSRWGSGTRNDAVITLKYRVKYFRLLSKLAWCTLEMCDQAQLSQDGFSLPSWNSGLELCNTIGIGIPARRKALETLFNRLAIDGTWKSNSATALAITEVTSTIAISKFFREGSMSVLTGFSCLVVYNWLLANSAIPTQCELYVPCRLSTSWLKCGII